MDHDEITVRVLDESEWSVYRDVRLRALAESPGSFTATLAEEADRDEQFWRDRMTQSHRLRRTRPSAPGNRQPRTLRAGALSGGGLRLARRTGGEVLESPGNSSRRRRLWRPSRLTCSSITGWGPTTGERSVSPNNFGFRTTDYRRPSRASDLERVRRLLWCCRWSPMPPWRRTRPAESQPPAKAPSS